MIETGCNLKKIGQEKTIITVYILFSFQEFTLFLLGVLRKPFCGQENALSFDFLQNFDPRHKNTCDIAPLGPCS